MIQAARSGTANILEGATQNSLSGYIKLAGVARGSLEELLRDYLSYARQHRIMIWDRNTSIRKIGFPNIPNQPESAVNLMITLINQANYLIDKLIKTLEEKHTKEGGFSENLLKKRLQYRNSFQ